MAAPAAINTALMMGETFSSCLVSMPMEAPPTFTPSRSLWGIGTTSEAIPRTTNITPSQNRPFIVFSFCNWKRALVRKIHARRFGGLQLLTVGCISAGPSRNAGKTGKQNGDLVRSRRLRCNLLFCEQLGAFGPRSQVLFLLRRKLVD